MKWVVGLSSGLVQAKFFFGKRRTSDIFHTVGRGCSRYKAFRIWMIGNAKKSENSFRIQFVISSAMINKKCLSKQGLGIKVVITLIAWAKGVDKTRNTEHSGACRNVLCSEFYLIELTDSVNRNFWFLIMQLFSRQESQTQKLVFHFFLRPEFHVFAAVRSSVCKWERFMQILPHSLSTGLRIDSTRTMTTLK